MFTRQVKVQKMEKYFNHNDYKGNMPTLAEINNFSSISSFTDRVFSIFRRKVYGSDQSEMGIKVIIPAPTQ